MVMRFIYGSPIEDEVGRLTAEDVPNHELDITEALNFADRIRSKEFGAKDVARALRDRLNYSNPNVQILVLSLTDICVKNGGSLIQLEISRREAIDAITGLLDSKTGRNYELRQLVLRLIQEWAVLFRGNPEMGYVCGVLERMKRNGYTFPKINVPSSEAMIDTASAPEWEDSPVCQRCRTAFTFTNRKHHCRNCGKCFCNDCSSNSTPIPRYAIYDSVRVCHGCYLRLKKVVPDLEGPGGAMASYDRHDDAPKPVRKSSRATPNVPDEDEDLKRAIELSLKEAESRPSYADYTLQGNQSKSVAPAAPPAVSAPVATATTAQASRTQYPTVSSEPYPLTSAPSNPPQNEPEEDDADLRAAIEASLRDMPDPSGVPDYLAAPGTAHKTLDAYEAEDDTPLSAFMPAADIEEAEDKGPLSTTESENVQLFESLLARIRDGGQDIRYDPQIQYLHESIEQLRPKITDAIESVDQKHTEFIKLHDRILTAIKIYDQLLDKRLRSSTYVTASSAMHNASLYPQQQQQQQSLYPALPSQTAQYAPSSQPQYAPANNPAFAPQSQAPYVPHVDQNAYTSAPPMQPQQPIYSDNQAVQTRSLNQPQSPVPSVLSHQAPQQQQQQQPLQHQQQLPPPVVPGSQAYGVSPVYSSAMQMPPMDASMARQSGAISPSAYPAPAPVSHVPSIPALQPSSMTPASSHPSAAPEAPPAPVASAPAASTEPEEALLIEL